MQYLFKFAYAYIIATERQFIICQIEEFEKAIVISRIYE